MVGVAGQILARAESLTEAQRGPAAVLDALERLLRNLLARHPGVTAIGVASAGQIDRRTGSVVYAPNLDWRDVPLGARLSAALGRPVTVENDVRAAAWGEFRFGAGAGAGSLVAVFVGTGVGSGAVLGGALWRGAGNVAGEIGHTQVVVDGLPCPCGRHGCLEQYASGSGFQRRLRAALTAGRPTRLAVLTAGDPAWLTAAMVRTATEEGDAVAREVWADAERSLTMAVANYVTLVNPEVLVLGGGVIETVPPLFDVVAAGVRELTTVLARSVRIERARLGDWSGVVGAACLGAPAS
ncbi:MAG: ROK family protein [Candidatus Rokubacteria bacterium]|nr:ROK family protein [Candidatus Rokubacteria bacterium]